MREIARQRADSICVRNPAKSRETGQPIKESDGDVPSAETAPNRRES